MPASVFLPVTINDRTLPLAATPDGWVDPLGRILKLDGNVSVGPLTIFYRDEIHQVKTLFLLGDDAGGTYRIDNVPVFRASTGDPLRPDVDEQFLDDMVASFCSLKGASGDDQFAWLPKIHVSHTDDSRGELPVYGFVDNLRRVNDTLFCDFRYIQKEDVATLRKGRFPDRSIELDTTNRRLLSVALLGATPPYHKLPQMRLFEEAAGAVAQYASGSVPRRTVRYDQMNLADILKGFIEAAGARFAGSDSELAAALVKFSGADLPELLKKVQALLVKRKTAEVNGKAEYADVTLDDVQRFVCDNKPVVPTPPPGDNPHTVDLFKDDPELKKFAESSPIAQSLVARMSGMSATLEQFSSALKNLNTELSRERTLRQETEKKAVTDKYRAELVTLRAARSTAVSSPESIDTHLGIIMQQPDDAARVKYMDMLKAAPKLERERIPLNQTTGIPGVNGTSTKVDEIKKYKAEFEQRSDLRSKLGQHGFKSAEEYALVMAYADVADALTNEQDQ